jgi:hypothetical protein
MLRPLEDLSEHCAQLSPQRCTLLLAEQAEATSGCLCACTGTSEWCPDEVTELDRIVCGVDAGEGDHV